MRLIWQGLVQTLRPTIPTPNQNNWVYIDFSDACLIDDGTAEPFDILGNDEKGDFDESCDSADSGEDVEIHLGIGLQWNAGLTG